MANAIKETVSRVLILAVYLGWGVVRPRLERKTTYAVAALAVAFFGSSLWNQLRDIASTEALGLAGQQAAAPAVTFDAIMVAFLNSVFILWIYSGGLKVMRELKNTSQTEKLNMYRRLTKRLFICITAFILFSFAALIVTRVSDSGSFGWQLLFLIDRSSIWSVLFLAVLVAIAAIWRPSETTARYSYSHQPVEILRNTFSDRTHCIARLRPGSSFPLSALRFFDRIGQVDDDDDGGEEMAHEIGEVDIIPGDSDDDAGNNNVVDAGQVELEMVAPLEKRSPKGESDDDKTGVNPGDIVEM